MSTHILPVQIYYEDTDAGGVVYHANHFKFAERGRSDFLKSLGFTNAGIREKHGVIFLVRHIEASYEAPGRLEDELEMRSTIQSLGKTSFVMEQSLFRGDQMLFSMTVTLVCVDLNGKPRRIPAEVADAFAKYQES